MMKKNFVVAFLLLYFCLTNAQENTYPLFDSCSEKMNHGEQKTCFESNFTTLLFNHLDSDLEHDIVPEQLSILFDVDKKGDFNLIFISANNKKLKTAVESAFQKLPTLKPPLAFGRPSFMQFTMDLIYPSSPSIDQTANHDSTTSRHTRPLLEAKKQYDKIEKLTKKYQGELYSSSTFIPLSHEIYNRFDREINLIGTNSHTAQKPFTYHEVKPYYDFKKQNQNLALDKQSWLGRKIFDENLATVSGENYWLTVDFGVDLQLGEDSSSDLSSYNNTRIGYAQGGIGKKITFYGAIFESQGRFADYYNRLARSKAPIDGYPAIVPGRGVAKNFKTDGFDYPVTEGYINYKINENFNAQIGNHKNFIGDGYRSLFLSDNASPNPFVKLEAEFWKIKYTNIWMQARNTNLLTERDAYQTKFIALHHLSYNISKRLNIGLFEAALWDNEDQRGFDISYLNPLLFYQMVEFSTGTDGGKVMVGLNYKYKWTDNIYSYGQLLIDELSVNDVFGGNQSFKNKFGVQLGVKYFDAFRLKNLDLQLEYNQVRPFTYSHFKVSTNYTHSGHSLAHLWGANFREAILIARYRNKRWLSHAKFIYGLRGFEPEENSNPFYGSDLFGTENNIFSETGVEIGQGNKVNSYYTEVEAGYLINPATNLKIYINMINRNFNASIQNDRTFNNNTVWINFGLRTDLFNWYFDY